jgi:hypothetical protein
MAGNIDKSRFQRNFRRLLRRFSIDLREELHEGFEQIPTFIRSCKRTIASRVWAAIDEQSEGISDSMLQGPVDAEFKRQRLATYILQHVPTSTLDSYRKAEQEDDQSFQSDSASESDGSLPSEIDEDLNRAMRYSDSLENILWQSEALVRLRANFHSWINPESSKLLGRTSKLGNLHQSFDSANSEEKLLHFISNMTFVPREHLVNVSVIDQQAPTLGDRLKTRLEVYTKQLWDWWPGRPPRKLLDGDSIRLAWTCVSPIFLNTGSPSIFFYSY